MKKFIIKGIIEVKTGMHIGGNSAYSAIGMIDSPVIKDKLTGRPIIPGSSLKGKMRTLLSMAKNNRAVDFRNDGEEILRLFGSSEKGNVRSSRLQFSDCFYIENEKEESPYEIKFENTIDRIKVVANPRQIERVIRGTEFDFTLTYNAENPKEFNQDIENIKNALKLLEVDYIGGGGSRGNGRIIFKNLEIMHLDNDGNLETDNELTENFKDVSDYGKKIYL